MRHLRPIAFYTLLLAAMAMSVWWMLHVPARPGRAYRAIPEQAVWVSRHRNLAARWDQISRHPLLDKMAALAGITPEEWARMKNARATTEWIHRLGQSEAVISAWPEYRGGPWTVALAAWIGSESQTFRWWLQSGRVPGVVRAGEYGGRPLWCISSAGDPEGRQLFFVLEEGLWLAAWSRHPRELCHVLDAYDGARERNPAGIELRAMAEDDVAWCNLGAGPGPDGLRMVVREWTPTRFHAVVDLDGWEGMPAAPAPAGCPPGRIAAGWGSSPEMLLMCDWKWIREGLRGAAPWITELRNLADHQLKGPLALAMFGAPLWGRLSGLRTPGLALMAELREPEATEGAIRNSMDHLNARVPWGLIAGDDLTAPGVRVFEASGARAYRDRPSSERAAYAIRDGWLWASLSADTLRGLAGPAATTNGVDERRALPLESMPWKSAMDPQAPVSAWLDLERSGRTLRMAMAIYELGQAASGADPHSATMQWTQRLRSMMDQLEPLSQISLRAYPEAGRMRLDCTVDARAEEVR